MAPSQHVRIADSDGILTFTLTRDEKLNAVSPVMIEQLRKAVTDLAERDDLRVLVIAAEGRYFTAGVDIGAMEGNTRGVGPTGHFSSARLRQDYRKLHLLFDEIEAIEKPVILAAHAPCLGVGVEFSASCDFRITAEGAVFRRPEVANLGVIPGSEGISRVTCLIGALGEMARHGRGERRRPARLDHGTCARRPPCRPVR